MDELTGVESQMFTILNDCNQELMNYVSCMKKIEKLEKQTSKRKEGEI